MAIFKEFDTLDISEHYLTSLVHSNTFNVHRQVWRGVHRGNCCDQDVWIDMQKSTRGFAFGNELWG